jgi:hypothetical protein
MASEEAAVLRFACIARIAVCLTLSLSLSPSFRFQCGTGLGQGLGFMEHSLEVFGRLADIPRKNFDMRGMLLLQVLWQSQAFGDADQGSVSYRSITVCPSVPT